MDKVYIQKQDETYIQVWSDNSGVEQEIHEQFTFEVKGYQHMPAYKSGRWDGKIRLYNIMTKRLYVGLQEELSSFVRSLGYEVVVYEVEEDKQYLISRDQVESYLSQISLSRSDGQVLQLRNYQIDAIVTALTTRRTILLSATSSGKSLQIYCIIRYLQANFEDFSVMLIVPSKGLVEQMYSDFADYSTQDTWNVEDNVQKISGDYSKEITKSIVITTWQSQQKQPAAHFNKFKALVVDEAHEAAAASLTRIMELANKVPFKIGATGTLKDCKMNHLALTGLFGVPYTVVTTRDMIDMGAAAELKIKCLILDHPDEVKKLFKQMMKLKTFDYQTEIDYIVTNESRNNFIANLAADLKGNTLILFNLVEKQGKVIRELLKAKTDKNIYYIDGAVSAAKREEFRNTIVERETDCILLASYGTTSRGYSVSNIDNIIFASPTKSKVRNLQSIGRGLRLSEGKLFCTLYDVADDFTTKSSSGKSSKPNFTLKHFLDRITLYTQEQFNYKTIRVPIK